MTKENNNKEDVLLKEKEVWSILEFAQSLSGIGSNMPISIDMLNQALKNTTLGNTGEVTVEQVENALAKPKESEDELRRISQSFDITSSIYKRLLSFMGNLASFDYTYTATRKDGKPQKYNEIQYKKDSKILENFMDSFDYKSEFIKVSRQIYRNEAYFSVLRDEGDKYVLQELPQDRCKITGRFSHGILFSFDYMYFATPGIDIDFFPHIFKTTLVKLEKNKIDAKGYNPSDTLLGRGNHGFAQWVDTSPLDNFWMFKFTPEIASRIPYFAGLFPDLVNQDTIRELQKSDYLASAAKIIMGEVPLLNGKAAIKDAISISPDLLGKFLALVKSSLNTEAVKVAASPLQNVESFDFKSDPNISSSYLKNTLASSGVSSNLLFSQDAKLTVLEAALSMNIDEILAESVYPQFNDFIDWHVNKRTKNYKFEIKFEGSKTYTNYERRLDKAMELAQSGIVLPQRIASGMGMSPFQLERELAMAKDSGFVDNLTPILMSGQMSKEEISGTNDDAGAPTKKDKDLSESGSQTREVGGNDSKQV